MMSELPEESDEAEIPPPRAGSAIPVVQFWERDKVESLFTDIKLAPGSREYAELYPDEVKCEKALLTKDKRLLFLNNDRKVLSIYRSIILDKKVDLSSHVSNELDLIRRVTYAVQKTRWLILMLGGGSFAGAVFNGSEPVVHKTFHSYTVRAKQGSSQSSKDNKSANNPRSAGASLRRYNELTHKQHIQEILTEWKEHIHNCDLIFYRCPITLKQILFGGKAAPLVKQDKRLRSIPFATGKATYSAVKAVHYSLTQITVHGDLDTLLREETSDGILWVATDGIPWLNEKPKSPKKRSEVASKTDSRLPPVADDSSSTESESDVFESDLVTEMSVLSLDHLNPYGSTAEDMRLQDAADKRQQNERDEVDEDKPIPTSIAFEGREKDVIDNAVYTACRTGNLIQLKALCEFSRTRDITEVSDTLSANAIEAILLTEAGIDLPSLKFGAHGKTLLHLAADGCHKEAMWWLLEQGCDPTVKNGKGETPYLAAKNKDARNHFRRYMAAYPDQYNYEGAQIPGPLTKQMEKDAKARINLKKKEKQKAKHEKEKKLEEERKLKKKEEEEREKFLALSDREKRAAAAMFRRDCSNVLPEPSSQVLRCHRCAKDISRMIPFEYLDFQFCSTLCVKEQRSLKR